MRAFTQLIEQLDRAGSGETSQTALNNYILHAPEEDLNWAIAFLLNARPFPRLLSPKQLLQAAKKAAGVTDWLADTCREEVGDVAELAALLAPRATQTPPSSLSALLTSRCLSLRTLDDQAQEAFLRSAWQELDLKSRRIWHRILLGTLRFNVERSALAAALSQRYAVPTPLILQRFDSPALSNPAPDWVDRLVTRPEPEETQGWPLPWGRLSEGISTHQAEVSGNGWICEWIPRGRRLQLVRRTHRTFLWSPEGDLLNRDLPELIHAAEALDVGIALEGIWVMEPPNIDADVKSEPSAGEFWVEGVLEHEGIDQRDQPLEKRRQQAEQVLSRGQLRFQTGSKITPPPVDSRHLLQSELFSAEPAASIPTDPWPMRLSAATALDDWNQIPELRSLARASGYAGIKLRAIQGAHPSCEAWRSEDGWWLPNDLLHCTAVLLSVDIGESGPEYSVGVQQQGRWLTIARLSGELPESDRREVAAFMREHTTQSFGSTRLLEPSLVVRLSYAYKARSSRHKSGLRLVGASWVRLMPNASPQDCVTLDDL